MPKSTSGPAMYAQTRSCRRRHGSASTDNVAARLDVGAPPPSFLKDEYGLPQMVFTDLGVVSSQVPLPPCPSIAAHCTTSTLPHPHKTTCTSVCRFCCLSAWVVETPFWLGLCAPHPQSSAHSCLAISFRVSSPSPNLSAAIATHSWPRPTFAACPLRSPCVAQGMSTSTDGSACYYHGSTRWVMTPAAAAATLLPPHTPLHCKCQHQRCPRQHPFIPGTAVSTVRTAGLLQVGSS